MVKKVAKKKPQPKPKPKKMVTKYRVLKDEQWRDFNTQQEARDHLVRCLAIDAFTFCSIKSTEVEKN